MRGDVKIMVKGEGQTFNGFRRCAGMRNRRFRCDSEYHLAPNCPLRSNSRNESAQLARSSKKAPRPPDSSKSAEAPVGVRDERSFAKTDSKSNGGKAL